VFLDVGGALLQPGHRLLQQPAQQAADLVERAARACGLLAGPEHLVQQGACIKHQVAPGRNVHSDPDHRLICAWAKMANPDGNPAFAAMHAARRSPGMVCLPNITGKRAASPY
jgi:hypothetical protein